MKKCNIIVGRFQPFTKGHLKCVEEAYQNTGLDTIICMIDTKLPKEKSPFTSQQLFPILKEATKTQEHISDVVLVKSANIIDIGDICKEIGYEVETWTCGSDRVDSYTRMLKYVDKSEGLSKDMKIIEVKRGEEDYSATKVRKTLTTNKLEFCQLTPEFMWSSYGVLKQLLMNVYTKD